MSTYYKPYIVCVVLGLAVFSLLTSEMGRELPQEIRDRLYSCGVNSLYLFLNLRGHQTNFETLKSTLGRSSNNPPV